MFAFVMFASVMFAFVMFALVMFAFVMSADAVDSLLHQKTSSPLLYMQSYLGQHLFQLKLYA